MLAGLSSGLITNSSHLDRKAMRCNCGNTLHVRLAYDPEKDTTAALTNTHTLRAIFP